MPAQAQQLTFKVNGTLADEDKRAAIEEIVVDATVGMPSMARLYLNDEMDLGLIAGTTFKIGANLEIIEDKEGGEAIFKGEITSLEADFSDNGHAFLIVHAYDKSHRLHRGKKSRTFLNQNDGQIVRKMIGEAGLQAGTIGHGIKHEFMLQSNQTNMEWLLMRAEQLDYQIYVDVDEKFHFIPPWETQGGAVPELIWGDNLLSFRPRISTTHQVDKVTTYGWDQFNKVVIKGEGSPNGKLKPGSVPKTGGAYAEASFGSASAVILADVVENAKAAEMSAQGLANVLSGEFAYAEGVCYGNADILPAGKVNVKITSQAKSQFSGKYSITSVQQIYRVSTGQWNTHFVASGRRPNTLKNLVGNGETQGQYNERFLGIVPALVTNFQDPKNLGRVKVKFPWMFDESDVEIESDWVRIATPFAGTERGFQFIPEVNDEVLVAFEHGNVTRPYIIGCLWNSKDKPPLPSDKVHDKSNITKRLIKSRSGHIVILDDTKGSEQIVIRDKSEKNEIIIDTKNNSISIKCDKDITLDAGGNINLKAKGGVNIDSTNDTKIVSNAGFKVEGKAGNEIKGARLTVDVQGNIKMSSSVIAELKANLIKVDGGLAVEVKGGIIKLN
ncbi:MAG: VgrG-related protein [Caldilineaceae bacterium]|nr:VgrG-related protein [Caldilineaceae bacterium]